MSIESRRERRTERRAFKDYVPATPEEAKYYEAAKRVKKIKGFYTHAAVYIMVNVMIIIINIQELDPGESYFQYHNFFTAFFWGLGLLAHGLSLFLPGMLFGDNWEEKKIKELMEKDKSNKWE
ncbi:2TM domain-containing protein [Flavobacterium amniphilum]|uniref:2TM domain-containing protein n=1 Tax=Flavobacterium amniphilum TaxID=1834035 RepID=UPI00202A7E22|nr:2TM domain-containing protein [Flavobacterium amniphilum]MCL9805693.1 2TM domain-containing protein [Flavobacterium amniphilum]